MRNFIWPFLFFFIFVNPQITFSNTIDSLKACLLTKQNDTAIVDLYNELSINYWREFDSENKKTGIKYLDSALALSPKINYQAGLAKANYYRAKYYISDQLFDKATSYLLQSLTIYDQINDINGISECHLQSGVIAYLLQNFSKAQEHLKKCISYKNINASTLLTAQYLLAICLSETGDFQSALTYFNNALSDYTDNNDTLGLIQCYAYLGKMYLNEKNNDKAFEMLRKGIELGKSSKNYFSHLHRCYAFLSLAYMNENKIDSAIYFGELAINPFDILTNKIAMFTLSKVYSKKGDYKKAYHLLDELKSLSDSVFSITMVNSTAEQRSRFEFETKMAVQKSEQEKKDAIAIKELQKQKLVRNGFIGGTISFLLLASAIFIGLQRTGKAKKKSEELLLNILPAEVADEIKMTGTAKAKSFTMVTVMFTDFKGFTTISEKVSAELLVDEINICFSAFDQILQKHKIEKIKTIGDAYLCASGLPVSNYTHAIDMLNGAIEIRNYMLQRKKKKEALGEIPFEMRIGIHTGPVVAGIVGVRKYAYDIWGDTVNLAARMEQNSEAGKINISGSTYELVKDKFNCIYRGKIQAKNKGEIDMYFVEV